MRLLLLFFLVNSGLAWGQSDSSVVKFLVEVDNGYFEILIDDKIYLKNYKTKLPPGLHTAKVWSPGYITNEVSFNVTAGQESEVHVKMAHTNQHAQFERDYADYRMRFHKSLTVPGTATLAGALTTGTFMMLAYDKKRTLLGLVDSYYAAPSYNEVVNYKEQINVNYKKYNRYRYGYYVAGGLTVGALITTFYTYRKFKQNNEEPVLNSRSPFADRFSWSPNGYGCTFKWRIG